MRARGASECFDVLAGVVRSTSAGGVVRVWMERWVRPLLVPLLVGNQRLEHELQAELSLYVGGGDQVVVRWG